MAKIIPFKAVRPVRDKVSLITSQSYETYSPDARDARMAVNPYTFLHIINPGFKYHKELTGKQRYNLVKNRFLEFKEDHVFVQDKKPCYYVYKKINRKKEEFTGVFCATSAWDYESNLIKKHEDTIQQKETLFKEYLNTVGFNAEPVMLTCENNEDLNKFLEKKTKERAEYEFTTTYRDTHYLWLVKNEKEIEKLNSIFEKMNVLYIADGHHRSASSYLLAKELKENNPDHTGKEPYNYFMSFLIPENNLKIYEFNRLIKGLNSLTKEEFLIALDHHYRIENRGKKPYRPSKKHHFCMYIDGEFYSLYLRKSIYDFSSSLKSLDTEILYQTILKPILGIYDVRNDNRISYTHGKDNFINLKNYVDSGEYTLCFNMLPITIEEIKNIADEGLTMPPKSTYIQPKLLSGLTIYEF